MKDMVEILTMHSVGEKDGKTFSPATLPYPVLCLFVENIKSFVIGGHGSKEERDRIFSDMEVAQRTGSWTVGVLVPSILLATAPLRSFRADLTAISARRFADISDASRAKAFSELRSGLGSTGVTHLDIRSDIFDIAATDVSPRDDDPAPIPEIWLDAEQYVLASPTLNVQLDLEGGRSVKADATVAGFADIGASVPEGRLVVRVAYQFNPRTNARRNERVIEVVRRPAIFDEKAFDEMAAMPNGWSGIADPVAEIRMIRDGNV